MLMKSDEGIVHFINYQKFPMLRVISIVHAISVLFHTSNYTTDTDEGVVMHDILWSFNVFYTVL